MNTKQAANRNKSMDLLDMLFAYYRGLETLGHQFPQLPLSLKTRHDELVIDASAAVKSEMGGNSTLSGKATG